MTPPPPAPRPTVWVCAACGRRSGTRDGPSAIDRGWDESCMLNAVECWADTVELAGGRAVRAVAVGETT